MPAHRSDSADWITRDHVVIVQAARSLADEPAYAQGLLAMLEDPIVPALELIALLMTERVDGWMATP